MITPEERAELKRLCEAATPGPWSVGGRFREHLIDGPNDEPEHYLPLFACCVNDRAAAAWPANARLVTAVRSALPKLLEEVERLERERDERLARARDGAAGLREALEAEHNHVLTARTERDAAHSELKRLRAALERVVLTAQVGEIGDGRPYAHEDVIAIAAAALQKGGPAS